MALMMTILSRIKKFFVILFTILKKPFCCRRRSRRNSDNILPITIDKSAASGQSFNSYPPMSAAANSGRTNWPQSQNFSQSAANSHVSVNSNPNVDDNSTEPDVDFFKDMVPAFKKPKKILLASNQSMDSQNSNRFGVDTKATIFQSKELGVIEHYEDGLSSWEDNTADEMLDTDQTLRHIRQQEREKRIAEHQRIKMEKEFKRSKQQKSNLLATKIS